MRILFSLSQDPPRTQCSGGKPPLCRSGGWPYGAAKRGWLPGWGMISQWRIWIVSANLTLTSRGSSWVEGPMDVRRFIAHQDEATYFEDNPMQHYVDRGYPFPQRLLGYKTRSLVPPDINTPQKQSIQISDIPEYYLEASGVHICPIDHLSHIILPSVFRQGRATTITLSPSPGYMTADLLGGTAGNAFGDHSAYCAGERSPGAFSGAWVRSVGDGGSPGWDGAGIYCDPNRPLRLLPL